MASLRFMVICTMWSIVMAKKLTVIFLDGEKIVLDPPPHEMRTRIRDDGSQYDVIPGSVGLGYIVEELNARMIEAKKKGLTGRCQQLQQLCHAINLQRKSSEENDIRQYGKKIKLSQEEPLLCSQITDYTTSTGSSSTNENGSSICWLMMGACSGLILCYVLYRRGLHKDLQSKRQSRQRLPRSGAGARMLVKKTNFKY